MSVLANHVPKRFSELVFATLELRKHLKEYADGRRGGSLLLHGTYGTGKSTCAKIIQQELHNTAQTGNEPECVEASLVSTDFTRSITGLWHLELAQQVKYPRVIINEVDQLAARQQNSIRALIDKHPSFGFIFTTNNLKKVNAGIRDRCDVLEIPMPHPDFWVEWTVSILASEGIKISEDQALRLAMAGRKSIRELGRALDSIVAKNADKSVSTSGSTLVATI